MSCRKTFSYKEQRRLSKNQLKEVFLYGKKERWGNYLLVYLKNNIGCSRVAVSLRSKLGNAVYRNKEKRIMREIIRTNKLFCFPVDAVTVKLNSAVIAFQEAEKQIVTLFRMIDV